MEEQEVFLSEMAAMSKEELISIIFKLLRLAEGQLATLQATESMIDLLVTDLKEYRRKYE